MLATSLVAVLVAAGWWWLTWPDRTLAEFERLIAAKDFVGALSMIAQSGSDVGDSGKLYLPLPFTNRREERSISDVLLGVRRFGDHPHHDVWVAERGRIVVAQSCIVCHRME
jgi:hypothetical protein